MAKYDPRSLSPTGRQTSFTKGKEIKQETTKLSFSVTETKRCTKVERVAGLAIPRSSMWRPLSLSGRRELKLDLSLDK